VPLLLFFDNHGKPLPRIIKYSPLSFFISIFKFDIRFITLDKMKIYKKEFISTDCLLLAMDDYCIIHRTEDYWFAILTCVPHFNIR